MFSPCPKLQVSRLLRPRRWCGPSFQADMAWSSLSGALDFSPSGFLRIRGCILAWPSHSLSSHVCNVDQLFLLGPILLFMGIILGHCIRHDFQVLCYSVNSTPPPQQQFLFCSLQSVHIVPGHKCWHSVLWLVTLMDKALYGYLLFWPPIFCPWASQRLKLYLYWLPPSCGGARVKKIAYFMLVFPGLLHDQLHFFFSRSTQISHSACLGCPGLSVKCTQSAWLCPPHNIASME